MNILMLVSWYSPHNAEVMEAGIFHYEQSMALKKYCNVALYFPYGKDLECNFMKDVENGLLTYRRRKIGEFAPINFWHMFCDFIKIRKEFKPDIIHAHVATPAGKIAIILGKIFRIPVIITEHKPIEMANLSRKKTKKWTKRVYHNSEANVCVSSDSMVRLKEIFPDEKFQVIYNGIIDPNHMEKDGCRYAKEGYINCCIVASFYSKDIKGYQYLLPAIKELINKGYRIVLHICGGGVHFEYYKKMARDLGIEEACVFYGQCDRKKVYSIVEQMDFNISASIFECSGVSVQEAMLLGKPLLVTKSGGANSLVTSETAIVVNRKSTKALVNGIEKMIVMLSEFDSDVIKRYARKNFEMEAVTKQYLALYSNVLKKYK